jgi:hypothetical protein
MSEGWVSPREESSGFASPEDKRFDFGPRVMKPRMTEKENRMFDPRSNETLSKSSQHIKDPNLPGNMSEQDNPSPSLRLARCNSQWARSSAVETMKCSDQSHSSLVMKIDIANSRISQLERERDEWKGRAEAAMAHSEQSLGDMLSEIELETLRDEISRLRGLLVESNKPVDITKDDASMLRLRCAELETQLANMRRERLQMEQKNKDSRNADQTKIRSLQEQIMNERKMRERMANSESALPVVTVGGPTDVSPSNSSVVKIKPRSAAQTPVPAFVVDPVPNSRPPPAIDPKLLDKTTLVLPPLPISAASKPSTGVDTLGDDALAEQWRICLKDRPQQWRSLVSRQAGSSIFSFGNLKIACKKIGNHTMIQVGRETMLLEKFLDTYGPKETVSSSKKTLPGK